jgi:hypothetical protein
MVQHSMSSGGSFAEVSTLFTAQLNPAESLCMKGYGCNQAAP